MAYGLSNGHVTDDVTVKSQTRDPNTLERNISKSRLLELETSNLVCSFVS